jgi:hypothetical protein
MKTFDFELIGKVTVTAPSPEDARDLVLDVFSGEMQDFGIVVTSLELSDGD